MVASDGRRTLYNLTAHVQHELAENPTVAARWCVEHQPRLRIINPQKPVEIKSALRMALRGIPVGSDVLVGGLSQFVIHIAELRMFRVFFVLMLRDACGRSRPVGVIQHEPWARAEKYDIERNGGQIEGADREANRRFAF